MSFSGRVALVTGGAGGLGLAIGQALSDAGAQVWLADKSFEAADVQRPEGFRTLALDVANRQSVWSAVDAVHKVSQRIDLLVNSAGIARQTPFLEMDPDSWDEHIAILLSGTFYTCRAIAPGMVARGYGRILNIASIGGLAGPIDAAHYGAAKAGVIGLTRAIATELADTGLTCNAIAPGPILTDLLRTAWTPDALAARHEQVPARRLGTKSDVVGASLYLLGEQAGYVNGITLPVDGGSTAAGSYAVERYRRRQREQTEARTA
jgi:3-oxoacyl-[acyl-carrier protein] reductase